MKLAIRNILWPTDFSPLSLASADAARALAGRFGATLHVVHVAPVLTPDSTIAIESGGDLLISPADIRGGAAAELDRLITQYFGGDGSIVRAVRVGTAWREICDYALAASVDFIVIASHGLTGLKRALLGSVAERVVQHAACPVLVVKDVELASVG